MLSDSLPFMLAGLPASKAQTSSGVFASQSPNKGGMSGRGHAIRDGGMG